MFKMTQKGFSLVEALVAVGIISAFALSMAFFASSRKAKVLSASYKVCSQTAKATLTKISSLGVAKAVADLDMSNNQFQLPAGPKGVTGLLATSDEWLKNGDAIWQHQSGDIVFKNYRALLGSMSVLNSLYNKDTRYCNSPNGLDYKGTSPIQLFDVKDFGHLKNLTSTLKIQTYDLASGALSCEPGPLILMPSGSVLGSPLSKSLLSGVRPESGARSDLGFWVTVTTQYTDNEGINKSCAASKLFSYPRIAVNANDLNGLSVNIAPGSTLKCDQSLTQAQVDIQVTQVADYKKKAMVLVCRDQSQQTGPTSPACPGGPVRQAFPPPDRAWKSCSEVSLCGLDASTVNHRADGLSLVYNNLSFACEMSIEARLVDAAHNIAANASSSGIRPAVPLPECFACTGSYTGPGWCPGGGRTMANTCTPAPPGGGTGDGGYGPM